VLDVIAGMRKTRKPVSDAEITQRAEVNPQYKYLQRHRDLKAEAEAVRAHLDGDRPRAAAAAAARKDAALEVENRMLLEQNTALRRDLEAARAELRAVRLRDLAASVLGDPASAPGRDAEAEAMRGERDQALTAVRRADTELLALRNVVNASWWRTPGYSAAGVSRPAAAEPGLVQGFRASLALGARPPTRPPRRTRCYVPDCSLSRVSCDIR